MCVVQYVGFRDAHTSFSLMTILTDIVMQKSMAKVGMKTFSGLSGITVPSFRKIGSI